MQRVLAAICLLLLLSTSATAAPISWALGPVYNGPNGFNAIQTQGDLVRAVNFSDTNSNLTVDPGGLNMTFTPQSSIFANLNLPLYTGAAGTTDAAWNAIVDRGLRRVSGASVHLIELAGLTAGREYTIQLFANRTFIDPNDPFFFSDGFGNDSPSLEYNEFTSIFGTFVADAATQTIRVHNDDNPILNAYVLRATPVPEPTSLAIACMVSSLAFFGRRRRKQG